MTKTLKSRITKYSIAASAATAVTVASSGTADADLAFLDLSGAPVTSIGSVETFVDILGFAQGASTISISTATSSASVGNPLAPNSEFMIRGAFGATQVRGNNGAAVGYYAASGYNYLSNVGAVGNLAANFNASNNTMYYDGYGGPFAPGAPGIAHFTFTNTADGNTYNGWLHIQTDGVAGDRQATLTGITVDTGSVPEPSGMALLALGAAGIAGYRRRRESLN